MYPFAEWRPATERFWARLAARVPAIGDLPAWDLPHHAAWSAHGLTLSQSCGWPLATRLGRRVQVVGAFSYRVPGCEQQSYRSVVIVPAASEAAAITDCAGRSATIAANAADSLSGWVSALAAAGVDRWPGPVRWTGSHLASLRAVAAGEADVATIDAVTFAYASIHRPQQVAAVRVIGHGPLIPTLPVITSIQSDDALLDQLRSAIGEAIAGEVGDTLLIESFGTIDRSVYDELPARFRIAA